MNTASTLVTSALFAVLVLPAFGEPAGPAAKDGAHAATIPDFSGVWFHPAFPWYEPPASGPGPVTNRSLWPQRPGTAGGSQAVPPTAEGVSDYDQLVGDYTNPILQPWAAEVVKKLGKMSLAGITFPNPANQCWPEPVPFIFKEFLGSPFSGRTRSYCCTTGTTKCAACGSNQSAPAAADAVRPRPFRRSLRGRHPGDRYCRRKDRSAVSR